MALQDNGALSLRMQRGTLTSGYCVGFHTQRVEVGMTSFTIPLCDQLEELWSLVPGGKMLLPGGQSESHSKSKPLVSW